MFSTKKPYSSVTVAIERLTSEQFEDDDFSGIPDLVEVIKLQATGPAEAARALRKKLKYGNVHRQLRALTILDGLIQNAGSRFQRAFADEPLLERLRVCGTSDLADKQVRDKCKLLFAEWSQYKKTPGLERIAVLYKELPRRKQTVQQDTSKVLKETERDPFEGEDEEEDSATAPVATSSKPSQATGSGSSKPLSDSTTSNAGAASAMYKKHKKDKKSGSKTKPKPFNLEAEKPKMKQVISESGITSVNLLNALQFINREHERVSENVDARKKFEACKTLRRHILRYIQYVESEQYLGALINANDNLVLALMTFEQLDRSVDADSDSEDEMAEQAHLYKMATKSKENSDASQDMASLSISPPPVKAPRQPPRPISMPPRPVQPAPQADPETPMEDEDENDPFGDSNALQTPAVERGQPTWKVV